MAEIDDRALLLDILKRFPLAGSSMLEAFFGKNRAERLISECAAEIRAVPRTDGRMYYVLSEDDFHMLPGVSRRELVRKFAVNKYGYSVLKNGISPCKNADMIFYDESRKEWKRIWGDMGYLAPESLMMFRAQPIFGSNLIDIIVTAQGSERMRFLKAQVEMEWTEAGPNRVQIYDISGIDDAPLIANTEGEGSDFEYDISMENYPQIDFSKSNTPKMHNDTKKKAVNTQRLRSGEIAFKSTELNVFDYDLLRYIACNPFLEKTEIGILYSGDCTGRDDRSGLKKESQAVNRTLGNIDRLTRIGLLKKLDTKNYMDRYIPTWHAIDLLGYYHGAIPLYMQKYCQWPQIRFEKEDFEKERKYLSEEYPYFDSHNYYAERWAELIYEHQKLCREFCNALVLGARTLKSTYGVNIETDNLNTVAANLKAVRYKNGVRKIQPIHPDGHCTLTHCKGQRTSRYQLFFEIERNTNSKQVLIEKINTYAKVIPAARTFYRNYDDVVLIFFFDDRSNTHGNVNNKIQLLLKRMKEVNITGYVSTYSLATENIPVNWIPKYSQAEEVITGHMMLYRDIWYSTLTGSMDKPVPLLGISFAG
ncbi:MAG: hypothetical protein IJI14_11235 [Anaerolineaceae bacterium]|nr:hypothetical protein [Anaerolineaceae bacterium]